MSLGAVPPGGSALPAAGVDRVSRTDGTGGTVSALVAGY